MPVSRQHQPLKWQSWESWISMLQMANGSPSLFDPKLGKQKLQQQYYLHHDLVCWSKYHWDVSKRKCKPDFWFKPGPGNATLTNFKTFWSDEASHRQCSTRAMFERFNILTTASTLSLLLEVNRVHHLRRTWPALFKATSKVFSGVRIVISKLKLSYCV